MLTPALLENAANTKAAAAGGAAARVGGGNSPLSDGVLIATDGLLRKASEARLPSARL